MAEYASGDLRVGTLKVISASESASRDAASEFGQGLTGKLSGWGPARAADCSLVKLAVERRPGETVAEAATRAMTSHFGEIRRG